jgi:hypothetical protein
MFIHAIVLAVIIGYILKGRLGNLEQIRIRGINFIIVAFIMEYIIVLLIKNSIIKHSIYTYILDLIMYSLLFIFTYLNKDNKLIFCMGIGFLLNAIPIFFNGGAMPVGVKAMTMTSSDINIKMKGLYTFVDENTRFWYLGDVIPFRGFIKSMISIGDIIAAIGMMLIIIKGMREQGTKSV